MQSELHNKLRAMLWDIQESKRDEIINQIVTNPSAAFLDNQLFIRALNSLAWYDLTSLLGKANLLLFLSEEHIKRLFPQKRRIYYLNARKLLSKYSLSSPGQGS
jgi:hypothetical protein